MATVKLDPAKGIQILANINGVMQEPDDGKDYNWDDDTTAWIEIT